MNLTPLEQIVLESLIANLYAERYYSDVSPEQLSGDTAIPITKIRGVLSSLIQKKIVHVEHRRNDCSIVYLREEHFHLHPRWSQQ